jgi:hypothetical protein
LNVFWNIDGVDQPVCKHEHNAVCSSQQKNQLDALLKTGNHVTRLISARDAGNLIQNDELSKEVNSINIKKSLRIAGKFINQKNEGQRR